MGAVLELNKNIGKEELIELLEVACKLNINKLIIKNLVILSLMLKVQSFLHITVLYLQDVNFLSKNSFQIQKDRQIIPS